MGTAPLLGAEDVQRIQPGALAGDEGGGADAKRGRDVAKDDIPVDGASGLPKNVNHAGRLANSSQGADDSRPGRPTQDPSNPP